MRFKEIVNIALVDDQTLVRKGVISLLTMQKCFNVILEAKNGIEFNQQLQNGCHLPDVCVLDIKTSSFNGYEILKLITSAWPIIKVLILTSCESEHNILQMLRLGAVGFVSKKSDPEKLYEAITNVYENGYHYSRDILSAAATPYIKKNLLNEKEILFLSYCCTEMTYKEIGVKMALSKRSVEDYSVTICQKLNIRTRIGLAMYALQIGVGHFELAEFRKQ